MRAMFLVLLFLLQACTQRRDGTELARTGDEIMIAGRLFHTGTRVVLFCDPGGYDAYRTEKRFTPWKDAAWKPNDKNGPTTPNRSSLRFGEPGRGVNKSGETLDNDTLQAVRGGGWSLEQLQQHIDQFVYHYDVCGTSRQCFNILHDHRGLSVHFMLDLDGTIYQTLDVKERAWHATTSNDRSVGIEIANIGAYPGPDDATEKGWTFDTYGLTPPPDSPLGRWYARDERGRLVVTPRAPGAPAGVHSPASNEIIIGNVQGQRLVQYDFTEPQYRALVCLTATLCQHLPRITPDAPRDALGHVERSKLDNDRLVDYAGLLGHYHLQTDKIDPGPAFDWEWVIAATRRELSARGAR